MNNFYILLAVYLAYGLLLLPLLGFLYSGWWDRREDILRGFSDRAIVAYFKTFHQTEEAAKEPAEDIRKRFKHYYYQQYGRRSYFAPLLLFMGAAQLLLSWVGLSLERLFTPVTAPTDSLPLLAIFAIAGAIMWIGNDAIRCWYTRRLSPADIYGWTLRLVIAVPTAYALKSLVAPDLAPAIAFFIGAFPTTQLFTFFRRISSQRLGLTDGDNKLISELQKLQGIDTRVAERFADEGVTTIMQLAYSDPIQLTIRTGYSYSLVNDWVCQALLSIYYAEQQPILAKWGLRSAYEMKSLWDEFTSKDTGVQAKAAKLVSEVTVAINLPESAFVNVLEHVAGDPYTEFLFLSWTDQSPEATPPKN